jgi:YD repeat-containing protein
MVNKLRLLASLLTICSVGVHAQSFAPIVFWNVPNYYAGGWNNIRYSDPTSAFTVEWAYSPGTNNPQCGKPSTASGEYPWTIAWDFADAYPVNPIGYPTGSFYNAHYMRRDCATGQTSGPYEYSSAARRFAGCTDSGPFYYSPEGLNCGTPPGSVDPELSRGPPCAPDCIHGDPINVAVGNKFEQKVEYEGSGSFPLKFSWAYNSSGTSLVATPQELSLGRNRLHNYARAVHQSSNGTVTTAYVSRPDGNTHRFNLQSNIWTAQPGINGQLSTQLDELGTFSGWTYISNDGVKELYNAKGQLIALINTDELQQSLLYDTQGRLAQVQDPAGRKLGFIYNTNGNIQAVQLPDGASLSFTYDAANNLATVTYPGGASRTYLYNEPAYTSGAGLAHALTGIVHEDGLRYAIFNYATDGRAISTEHAGGVQKFVVQYNADGSSVVTTPAGVTQQRTFDTVLGVKKPTSVVETCADCGP